MKNQKAIKTLSGTIYVIDRDNKTVVGGSVITPTKYVSCSQITLENPMHFTLDDGRNINTSAIVGVL